MTPAQIDLYTAMHERGVKVHFMKGMSAHAFRTDTHRACTRQAVVLERLGFVQRIKEDWKGYILVAKKEVQP